MNITEILLKLALSTINQTNQTSYLSWTQKYPSLENLELLTNKSFNLFGIGSQLHSNISKGKGGEGTNKNH